MSLPIKFGVCGVGRIGMQHCHYFSAEKDKYELVAVCDSDAQRAHEASRRYGGRVFLEFAEFLEVSDLELVIIATRSLDHARDAEQALAAGKTVLLEKPIGVTEADRQLLMKLDKDYPGKLFCGHNHRFEPAFQSILAILRSGLIGEVAVVKLGRYHPYRRRNDWQSLLECGGGQLSVWGPHLIDHALQCLDSPVRRVWGHLQRNVAAGDADDQVNISLTGGNDRLVEITISDMAALPGPYCVAYGDRGTLICQDEETIQLRYLDPRYEFPVSKASAGQTGSDAGIGTVRDAPWIDETRAVVSEHTMYTQVEVDMARHLHAALRLDIPFPIRNSDALEVVRVTEIVKQQNPQFNWLKSG